MKDDNQGKGAGLGTTAGSKSGTRSSKEISGKFTDASLQGNCASLDFADEGQPRLQTVPRSKNAPAKSELAEQIGVRLRSVYDDVLAQPVPERFLDLLRQLENASYAPAKKGET
jgi:hypothetical protein